MDTGAAATLGIDAEVGEDDELRELEERSTGDEDDNGGLPTGSPSDGTLFGLYNVVGGFLSSAFTFIFPGLRMLGRLGVPEAIINMLGTVFTILTTLAVASFVRGYDI